MPVCCKPLARTTCRQSIGTCRSASNRAMGNATAEVSAGWVRGPRGHVSSAPQRSVDGVEAWVERPEGPFFDRRVPSMALSAVSVALSTEDAVAGPAAGDERVRDLSVGVLAMSAADAVPDPVTRVLEPGRARVRAAGAGCRGGQYRHNSPGPPPPHFAIRQRTSGFGQKGTSSLRTWIVPMRKA